MLRAGAHERARPIDRGQGGQDRVLQRARPLAPPTPPMCEPPAFVQPRPAAAGPRGGARAAATFSAAVAAETPVPLWERLFLIGALLDQQDAFLNIPRVLRGMDSADAGGGAASDPLNFLLVAITLAGLGYLIWRRREAFARMLLQNLPILALCGVVLISPLWSLSPGLSGKRAIVHLNTVLLALYMGDRLRFDEALLCVAQAVGVAAIGSLVAGLGVHSIGVMHSPGLEGKWRGVYTHKNPLAQAMALGAVIEAYFVARGRRAWLHAAMLAIEVLLILKANSMTGLIIVFISLATFGVFLAFAHSAGLRRLMLVATPAVFGVALSVIVFAPALLEKASGRDATLTGRTELWAAVVKSIQLHPVLGYGFQAFWQYYNPVAVDIWAAIRWEAPNSHNGMLEVALGLGGLGVCATLLVLGQAVGRAARLIGRAQTTKAGSVALILMLGILVESFTEAVLVRQGDIDWLLLNLLSVICLGLRMDHRPRLTLPRFGPAAARARPVDAPSVA